MFCFVLLRTYIVYSILFTYLPSFNFPYSHLDQIPIYLIYITRGIKISDLFSLLGVRKHIPIISRFFILRDKTKVLPSQIINKSIIILKSQFLVSPIRGMDNWGKRKQQNWCSYCYQCKNSKVLHMNFFF